MKKRIEKLYITDFMVEGSGEFPIDMLRYDCAVPKSETDAGVINRTLETRRVRLRSYTLAPRGPEIDRWNSFNWKVIEIDGLPEQR